MKKLTLLSHSFGIFVLVFTLFYLIGAFTSISFNIADWSEMCRHLVGMFGGLIGAILGCIYYSENKDKHQYH